MSEREVILGMTNRALASRLGANGAELLAALLDSTVDGVYAVDGHGRVLFANSAALAILGYDGEAELLGRNSQRRSPPSIRRSPFPETDCPRLAPRVSGEVVRVDETGSSGVIGHSCRSLTRRLRLPSIGSAAPS